MRWKDLRRSRNVEDARSEAGSAFPRSSGGGLRNPIGRGTRRAGGMPSIGMIVVVLVIAWALGVNPLTLLSGGPVDLGAGPTGQPIQETRPQAASDDEMGQFVAAVLGSTEDTWSAIFERTGERYPAPRLVLFTGQYQSGCGFASAASGPFYCPTDSKVYIDLAFYEELRRRFKAPGDFAQAYVIAHEVGHHVQNVLGILPEFNRQRRTLSEREANALSVRVELQADCFAGVWAADAERKGLLESGDIEEAMNAATQIGDDAIQKRTQGYVVPESFNHGTSEQRRRWFRAGFDAGTISACDTFEARSL